MKKIIKQIQNSTLKVIAPISCEVAVQLKRDFPVLSQIKLA